ncbi:MAG TPA: c-type cytochrome biogenesis protein CcmI [Alphaproteobacteria bacterium]|nr:c-type cytochrome biogenesis protein CcmI [Alphaproteobacteria bacterium]
MFWLLAIAVTAIACAALYYAAAGRTVNASGGPVDDATSAHYRLQLKEIEADIASGRMGNAEGVAARAEMARELIRLKAEGRAAAAGETRAQRPVLLLAIATTALLAFGTYGLLGRPDIPSAPLAERPPEMTLEEAVGRVELQLTQTPDDLRGWKVLAPAYMQLGRFADAERAFRRIIELGGVTADAQTDLAEAIMMKQNGSVAGEPLDLLQSAAARDPKHVRSRFYLASEATRAGEYQAAIAQWNELIALAAGSEPWLETARSGLAAATAGLNGETAPPDAADIPAMVEGLSDRLTAEGGTIAEWTQLVRSRLVLGQRDLAQAAYDAARAAYPAASDRAELDVLAADNGLEAR